MNSDKSKDDEIEHLCQGYCQVVPNFKPDESKEYWRLRYLEMKRKQLSQAKKLREQEIVEDADQIGMAIQMPQKIYTTYSSLHQLITTYATEKRFEEILNTILAHKLEEFRLLINAINVKTLGKDNQPVDFI